ncbi:MAG: TolC family protein [Tannerellaceae bacterium]|nr:TolC family protein [Tannerellaceae bacterium]
MKNYSILFILAVFLSGNALKAQERAWTLVDCIEYAIEHNIQLKQLALEQESREISLNTSKYRWLPNLNASVGEDFSFGRSLNVDNTYVNQNSSNTSFGISTGMPLFDGFEIKNDIAAGKLDLMATIESLKKAQEDLAMNVTATYLDILYYKEIQKIAELQVSLVGEQVARTESLVSAGKVPLSQLYDMKAQLANDEVTLSEARNNVKLAILNLVQLLELERDGAGFDVVAPDTEDAIATYMGSILPPDNIYDHAVTFKPQIREQEYLLQSQEKNLLIARAGYYPKLNLSAGYYNSYYHSFGEDAINRNFSEQWKNNARKYIGLSLSIPIFNRFQTRNNVRNAKVAIINRQLIMDNTKKNLYKEIQQAYYNAAASQDKLIASGKSVEANEEAFKYAEERYNAGKSTAYEFNEAKTKLAQSLSEQAQAKYTFIFRAKILDFYNGTPIWL